MRPLFLALALLTSCDDPPAPPAPPSVPTASASVAATNAPTRSPRLQRFVLPGAVAQKAVCGDGSPASLYLREGLPATRDHWVIHLEEGATCHSAPECSERGAASQGAGGAVAGILDADRSSNPDFHGFTHVLIPACGGDGWVGDREASPATGGVHFRGRRIVAAVIEALRRPRDRGPSLSDAKLVVLSGGVGVEHHLDALAEALPHAKVMGVKDGGVVPLEAAEATARAALWGAEPDASCATKESAAACLDPVQMIASHLSTPLFLRMSLSDGIDDRGARDGARDAKPFAKAAAELLARREGAFAPASGRHLALLEAAFHEETVDGHRFAEVLGNWVFDRPGPKRLIDSRRAPAK